MSKHPFYLVWSQVPVDYYQSGIKKNFFQKIWHTRKISLAKKIIKELKFNYCLDVGCASGYMIAQIAKEFPLAKYIGVDIYDKAIRYAKVKYPNIGFKIASSENLPYKNGSFDLILFYETIEHVDNPKEALREIQRVLKKNGTLILTMDSGSLLFRIIWWFWENSTGKVWQGAHLHPFTHKELEQLIVDSKYKIKRKIFSHLGMEVTFVLNR